MANINPTMDRINPSKWDTPEKAVAGILLLGAGVGLFFVWGKIVPFVLAVLANTFFSILALIGIFLLLYVIFNPTVRTAVSYGLQMLFRAFAGFVVNTNKIEVMFIRLDRARKDLKKYDEEIGGLGGQKEDQDVKLRAAQQDFETAKNRIRYAENQLKVEKDALKRAELESARDLALIELASKEELIKVYGEGSDQLAKALVFFKRLRAAMDFAIKKSNIELTTVKAKYDNIKKMHSTMSSAMRIIKGNPDDNYMFELAIQKTQEEMNQKLGEVKLASEYAKEFISNYDIDKGVLLEKGKALLERGQSLGILKDVDVQSTYNTGQNISLTPDLAQQNRISSSSSLLD